MDCGARRGHGVGISAQFRIKLASFDLSALLSSDIRGSSRHRSHLPTANARKSLFRLLKNCQTEAIADELSSRIPAREWAWFVRDTQKEVPIPGDRVDLYLALRKLWV
jgi:hypothetical protein